MAADPVTMKPSWGYAGNGSVNSEEGGPEIVDRHVHRPRTKPPRPQELPRYDPIGEGRANSSGLVNPGRLLAPSPTSEWSELARGTIRPVGVIGRDKATCTGRLLSHFACLKGATCFWFSPAPRMARSPAVALGNGESDPSSWSSALPRRFLGNWTKSHF